MLRLSCIFWAWIATRINSCWNSKAQMQLNFSCISACEVRAQILCLQFGLAHVPQLNSRRIIYSLISAGPRRYNESSCMYQKVCEKEHWVLVYVDPNANWKRNNSLRPASLCLPFCGINTGFGFQMCLCVHQIDLLFARVKEPAVKLLGLRFVDLVCQRVGACAM